MTSKNMVSGKEAKRRLALLALSLLLAASFSIYAARVAPSIEEALLLVLLFLLGVGVYGQWSESIGAARLQLRQREAKK
jgi:protein-S-isoprenylcysteine O-methyltransferase Ste14